MGALAFASQGEALVPFWCPVEQGRKRKGVTRAALMLAGPVCPVGAGSTGMGVRSARGHGRGCRMWRSGGAVVHLPRAPELLEGGSSQWAQSWDWRGNWAQPESSASLSWLVVTDPPKLTNWLPVSGVHSSLQVLEGEEIL